MRHAMMPLLVAALVAGLATSPAAAEAPTSLVVQTGAEGPGLGLAATPAAVAEAGVAVRSSPGGSATVCTTRLVGASAAAGLVASPATSAATRSGIIAWRIPDPSPRYSVSVLKYSTVRRSPSSNGTSGE